jgi:hypothetical protein
MTETVESVVDAYGAAWLEEDPDARRALLDKAWSDGGVYRDPTADLSGRAALSDHIGGFHRRTPGARIVITSAVDAHHGKLRFTWRMLGADGATMLEGIDFGELAADGRLASITGFFGPLPPR